jgi:ABC-type glycerol-3-phosphate transport system substrate-binding protein
MSIKKYLWLLVVSLIISVILAACQITGQGATLGGDDSAPAREQITITVWDFGGAEFQWLDDIAIPEFNKEFPDIIIEHVGVPEDELGLKLETAIAAGEPPDIAIFPPPRIFPAGHVLPVDELMERDGIHRDDYCPLFHSDYLFAGGNTFEGKTYGLPIDTNVWGMVYNKDLFAAAGLPELGPADYISFNTWLEYAREINKPAEKLEDRVWGSSMFTPNWNSMNNYMSNPYVLGDDGRSCKGSADTDDWIQAFEALKTAYEEDLTTETAGVLLDGVQEDMFLQGKLGMQPGALGDALAARNQGLNVGFVGQPVVTEGWPGNIGGWNTSYYIMAATKHPDEAWEFLKWLSTKSPLVVPIGTDALGAGGGGLPGIPCYLPLLEQGRFAEQLKDDPLVADAVELTKHFQKPPFSPDIWTSLDPFYTAWTRMTEEGVDVATAVHEAADQCQVILDELWVNFDSLKE